MCVEIELQCVLMAKLVDAQHNCQLRMVRGDKKDPLVRRLSLSQLTYLTLTLRHKGERGDTHKRGLPATTVWCK